MDRSFRQTKKIILFIFFTFGLFFLSPFAFAAEKTKKNPVKPKKPDVKTLFAVEGVFQGNLKSLDAKLRNLTVAPIDRGPDLVFYVDKQTSFQNDQKKSGMKDLVIGNKLRISYIRRDQTYLANTIAIEKNAVLETNKKETATKNPEVEKEAATKEESTH